MARIFLSYRREDAAGHSGRLYDDLHEVFGNDVFRDIDTLEGGQNYAERINQAVADSDAFLAVIGDNWLTVTDGEGRRRLDKPDDWVRLEIRAALEQKVKVIPVLVGRAEMPPATALPDDIRGLVDLQAREVRHSTWKYGVNDLVKDLGGRSLWQRARIPLGIAACVAVVAAVLVASGGGDDPPASTAPTDEPCPPGVTAVENASCALAANVAEAYRDQGEPRTLKGIFSPIRNAEYNLECKPGPPAVCTTVSSTDPNYKQSTAAVIEIDR
jgi:hypothetical protein